MIGSVWNPNQDVQTNGVPSGEAARLQEENAQLRAELQREHEIHVRNLADFANYHRRTKRERAQAVQAGKRELILELLDVVDDFERALAQASSEPQPFREGVQAIYRRLTHLLTTQGVTTFESLGQRFDPTQHEAISKVEPKGKESGVIVEEFRRGYRWGNELLRPAQVCVAQ
ncbi:MAG TPA: nucleotide exchange factor GrpE [Blastocatellia bacterium]|nr:nucleotide exchange factor GrpE [Blastocatellia bacterium]